MHRIGIIGAGNIGTGVATDLVLHGIKVLLVDLSNDILKKAERDILKNIRFAPLLSKNVPKLSQEKGKEMIFLTTNFADLSECDFIIENVTENWEIKKKVYQELDRLMDPKVCFGCNTSCISITQIGNVN